jgi:hypothetical protein
MLKVTIDTNVLIDEQKAELVTRTKQLAEQGLIDIAVTTRVLADTDQDEDERRKAKHLKEFDHYPKVGALMRWDFSRLDSGDFLAGEEHLQVSQQIEKVLFGKIRADDKRAHNKRADVDHLGSHYFAKRDVFITQDDRMWRKRNVLREQLGIVVEKPMEFLSRFPECK